MKLLLNQNISKRRIPALHELYPDSSQVFIEDLETASDKQIWDFAKNNTFTIVSKDSDFHKFALIYGPPPKIIWLKCDNQSNKFIQDLLLNHAETIKKFTQDPTATCLDID